MIEQLYNETEISNYILYYLVFFYTIIQNRRNEKSWPQIGGRSLQTDLARRPLFEDKVANIYLGKLTELHWYISNGYKIQQFL